MSEAEAALILPLVLPLVLAATCCCCLCASLRAISRASPALLPAWTARIFASRAYQFVRWHLSAWGIVDDRTIHLAVLAQLVAGGLCFLLDAPDDIADPLPAANATPAASRHLTAVSIKPLYSRRLTAALTLDNDRVAVLVILVTLTGAQSAFLALGRAADNRFDVLASSVISLALAAILAPLAAHLSTALSIAAALAVAAFALLICALSGLLVRTMGFQSFLRLGGEFNDRSLYALILRLYMSNGSHHKCPCTRHHVRALFSLCRVCVQCVWDR